MKRLLGPVLTLLASCALLALAQVIWAHHTIPAYNPDPTPLHAAIVITLAIAAPAVLGALLSIIAIYLRLRETRS